MKKFSSVELDHFLRLSKEKQNEDFILFIEGRYKNYEILDYPEIEIDVRQVQIGENKDGSPIGRQEQYQRHIYDNLGFKNRETGNEEITLPNMGFQSFQGFKDLKEVIEFLDKKLTEEEE